MAFETGPSPRTRPTKIHTSLRHKDVFKVKTIRKVANTTKKTHTINGDFSYLLLRNDDPTQPIKVNFDTDDMASNYITLEPGAWLPHAIGVDQGTEIHFETASGNAPLEMLLWG